MQLWILRRERLWKMPLLYCIDLEGVKGQDLVGKELNVRLDSVRESALYVTLFLDCADIGHKDDEYAFLLSDELGNDYTAYPDEDNAANGYWFTKPEAMDGRLILKVIRGRLESDSYGLPVNDSYEALYGIPIELESSFWERLF